MYTTRTRNHATSQSGARPSRGQRVKIAHAVDELLLDTVSAGRRPMTLRYYRQQLEAFARWCSHEYVEYVHEVTPNLLRRYMASRRGAGLSPDTADAAYRALRRFFFFLVDAQVLSVSPLATIGRSKQELPVKSAFHPHEVARLVQGAGLTRRDHAFVLFLLDTGARIGEALAVTWDDIKWGRTTDKDASVVLHRTKNGRIREVPLSRTALRALRRYRCSLDNPKPNQPVWINAQMREALTPSGARQLCERLARQLGIDQANPHKFRRTFALEMLRNGCDAFRLARLLGHSNVSLLHRYLPITSRDLHDIHAESGPLSRY